MEPIPDPISNDYFSYVDTTLRTVYFNLKSCYNQESLKEIKKIIQAYETAPKLKIALAESLIDFNLQNNSTLNYIFFHEWHHYLQALAYPYLYYLSFVELRTLLLAQKEIVNHPHELDFSNKKFIRLEDAYYNNLRYQTFNFRFYWDGADQWLMVDLSDINPAPDENVFCLNDLIENSTSIFHYKIVYADSANATDYWHWIKNPANKSYKNLTLFLARKIGYEKVYKYLQALALLSFKTTEPLHAFCTLINYIGNTNLSVEEFLTLGNDILKNSYRPVDVKIYETNSLQDTPVGYISNEHFEKILEETAWSHLFKPAKMFNANRDELALALIFPEKEEHFQRLARNFQPIAIHYNFTDFTTRNTSFSYNLPQQDIQEEEKHLKLAELSKIKDTVLSLTTYYNRALPKTCHHQDCPYYSLDFCRRWNSIPAVFGDCHFPSWFAINFDKEIVPEKEKVVPLTKSRRLHFENIQDRLRAVADEKRNWNYYFDPIEKVYFLLISKDSIVRQDVIYIKSFLMKLAAEIGLAACANRVALGIEGYEDVETELFEIHEVIQWCKRLKSYLPELFFYINFDMASQHNFFLLPIFVRYNNLGTGEQPIKFELDIGDFEIFLKNELYIFEKFCQRHHLDPIQHFKQTFQL